MSPPPADDSPPSTGPPDRQTLRLLERTLAREPLVAATAFEPDTYESRLLVVDLDGTQYPSTTDAVRLDVRWFASGDFSFHYLEERHAGECWECRWDRHPNAHDSRLHFHRPPDATAVEDLSLQSLHPLDVSATVVTALEGRLEAIWASDP